MIALVDFTLKSTALLGAGVLLIPLMRRASASSRHAIWTSIFCAVTLLPLAAIALPRLPIPLLSVRPSPAFSQVAEPMTSSLPRSAVETPTSTTGPSIISAPPQDPRRWTLEGVAIGGWLAGLCLLVGRMLAGAVGVRRLRGRARPATSADLIDQIDRARCALRVRRRVAVLEIEDDVMPMTWGLWRPVVLMPAGTSRSAGPEEIGPVILHEIAHVARLDAISQVITQFVTAVLWFHPLAWMAQRAARLERERACDDVVLRHGSRPSEYAMELLMLVRAMRPVGPMVLGTLGAARRSQLDRRIRDILDRRVNRRRASVTSLVVAATLVGGSGPVAAMQITRRTVPTPRPDIAVSEATTAPAPAVHLAVTPNLSLRATPRVLRRGPGQTAAVQETVQAEIPWPAERAQMFQELIEIAGQLIDACRTQVRIGTMANIDLSQAETTLNALRMQARAVAVAQASPATPAQRADVRARFAEALRTLQADQTRFSVGLLRLDQFDADLRAGRDVVSMVPRPAAPFQPRARTLDELSRDLQSALARPTEAERADAFLALARATRSDPLTPDMVAKFVDAVSQLPPADRDRVLAEPIRVKPAGGG